MKIVVCGLGVIGFATAQYMRTIKGFQVHGYDVSSESVQNAEKHGIQASTEWDEVPESAVYIICVNTNPSPYDNGMANIFNVTRKIHLHTNFNKPLVIIESTILPGTCRSLHEFVFRDKAFIAHFPHRYWSKDPVNYGVRQPRILGAINKQSLEHASKFIKKLDIPFHIASSVEVAELGKLVENAFRFYEVAFAEELCLACADMGIDFDAVRTACNTNIRHCKIENWQVQIPKAANGIEGHCLPKDTRMLLIMSPQFRALQAAVETDATYKIWKKKSLEAVCSPYIHTVKPTSHISR